MEQSIIPAANLPGYESLKARRSGGALDRDSLQPYLHEGSHRTYLEQDSYRQYLEIPKGFVDESDAHALVRLGDALATEQLPRFLDAAGWAYTEAALVMTSQTAVNRIALLTEAESTWERSLTQSEALESNETKEWLYEDTIPYRTALNLAYVPMMKSLVVGNVTSSIIDQTFADTLAIAQSSLVQLDLADREQDIPALGEHLGFLHECNALLSLLDSSDPRYVPLPSSERADSGYFHKHQTHDITVINQHWGTIRKVIPMEVKASASMRDRAHYKALIVRGKMHLAVAGKYDPRYTTEAFAAVYEHTNDVEQQHIVDHATTTVKRLLALYQKGMVQDDEVSGGVTKFHDNKIVAPHYVGHSQTKRQ